MARQFQGDATLAILAIANRIFTQKECSGFFGGILPEQTQRDIIASNLGISKKNDFAMLALIGGECAGAVAFMPTGIILPQDEHSYRSLTSHELAETIMQLPRRPLLAGEEGIRLSLAGLKPSLRFLLTRTPYLFRLAARRVRISSSLPSRTMMGSCSTKHFA